MRRLLQRHLLLGFVEQPDNAWLYWSDLFGEVEIPALENPQLIYHEQGNRLLLVGDGTFDDERGMQQAEMELKAHALDIQDPRWVEQTIYSFEDDAEPGVSKGQVRFGRPETASYTVPESVSYGALFAAELVSEERCTLHRGFLE